MIPVKPVTVRESRGDASALSDQSLALPGNWGQFAEVRDTGRFLEPVGTAFVERDVLGVAEEVHRVSGGRCRVASCSCGNCHRKGHFPHAVVEQGNSGRVYPVFGFSEFGPHVVQRLREIHVSNNPNKEAMDHNRKVKARLQKRTDEKRAEGLEIIRAALESRKFDWKGPAGLRTRAY